MEIILILAYTTWAICSGYKILSERSEWLDTKAPLNIIVKIILSIIVGYVIAIFCLIYLIFKFLKFMLRI